MAIDHVVVLMLENRSFDHMLGWPAVEGTSVPLDPANPEAGSAPLFELSGTGAYRTLPDPPHEFADVTLQLFGRPAPAERDPATNDGFVLSYAHARDARGHEIGPEAGRRILGCLSPGLLPVLRTLATEFVVCDRWFASVPGPTWPNRDFVHAGTSMGRADSPSELEITWGYPRVRTIYQVLSEAGKSWKVYYHDIPQVFWFRDLVAYKDTNFARFEEFDADARQRALPHYSFIEPRYFNALPGGANDQHPPHDVRLGEHLLADVYASLRRDAAVWRASLLVVVYDEHGGFYDHVPPPAAINPDGRVSLSPPFRFDRLGVRVPALLISPWVARGRVDSTLYDHTSILAFLRKHFGLPGPLHRRDAAANSFERNFLDAPRDDAPATATPAASNGPVPVPRAGPADLARAPLSDYQRRLVALAAALEHPRTQHDAARFVADRVKRAKGAAPPPGKGKRARPAPRSGKRKGKKT